MLVQIPDYLGKFLDLFPTGSITCILKSINEFDSRIGGESIAIRIVGHPIARDLLLKVGPLTATSANISGLETLYSCDEAAKALGLSKNEVAEMLGLPTRGPSGVKRGYRGIKRGGLLNKK